MRSVFAHRIPPAATAAVLGGLLTLAAATGRAAGEATYRLTFDITWSAATHPQSFPGNAHFSGPVGGTHDAGVHFWAPDEPASLGIKRMAEWGQQTELAGEVQQAVDAGHAYTVLTGPVVPAVPASIDMVFDVSPDFPLVTLTTMIAPSPDWFLGVRDLDLRPGGQWVDELVVDLYPWDAGTDSGTGYTSPDQPTTPPVPVFAITGGPFTPGVPLGTFTFRLESVADVPADLALATRAYPNPFNPGTTIAWDLPRAADLRLTVHDLAGRRVRELWHGSAAAGPGRARWDGRDQAGRAVAAGTYVYRLESDAGRANGRLVLVK